MSAASITIRGCRFGKHGIRKDGKYYPAHYSRCVLLNGIDTITIYARGSTGRLPAELAPENDTDMMTDYFEGDRARFPVGTPEFALLEPLTK